MKGKYYYSKTNDKNKKCKENSLNITKAHSGIFSAE